MSAAPSSAVSRSTCSLALRVDAVEDGRSRAGGRLVRRAGRTGRDRMMPTALTCRAGPRPGGGTRGADARPTSRARRPARPSPGAAARCRAPAWRRPPACLPIDEGSPSCSRSRCRGRRKWAWSLVTFDPPAATAASSSWRATAARRGRLRRERGTPGRRPWGKRRPATVAIAIVIRATRRSFAKSRSSSSASSSSATPSVRAA